MELLCWLANNFDSEWIEASKKVLFELCPTTQRNIAHTGTQKDINNIKSCLKVLNECGENVPRFVSYHLDELPPVTFTGMDISCLLGRLEKMNAEVCSVKHALHSHADVSHRLPQPPGVFLGAP